METNNPNIDPPKEIEKSPSGLTILWREIVRDKVALISLIFFVATTAGVFIASLLLDLNEIVKVDLFALYEPPLRSSGLVLITEEEISSDS